MQSRFARFVAVAALAAASVALLPTPRGALAQSDAPPTAEALLAEAARASGGGAAAKLQSRHAVGALKVPALGLSAPFEVWQTRPNLMLMKVESDAIGSMTSGTDGETCWENSTMQGPRILADAERARALREADFDFLLNWNRHFVKAESAGADTVQERPAWKLLMTPVAGNVETWWLDAQSGLLVKQDAKLVTNMGEVQVTAWLEDYREVDGVLIPFRARQSLMNGLQVMVMATDSIAHDVQPPADLFALPAEIVALKAKATAK